MIYRVLKLFIKINTLFLSAGLIACDSGQNVTQRVQIINEIVNQYDANIEDKNNISNPLYSNTSQLTSLTEPLAEKNAHLSLYKVSVVDTIGNGDKQINRGETIKFVPVFLNSGTSATNMFYLRITSLDLKVTPINPQKNGMKVNSIPAGETLEVVQDSNSPQIRLDPQAIPGTKVEVIFKLIDTLTDQTYGFSYIITVQP